MLTFILMLMVFDVEVYGGEGIELKSGRWPIVEWGDTTAAVGCIICREDLLMSIMENCWRATDCGEVALAMGEPSSVFTLTSSMHIGLYSGFTAMVVLSDSTSLRMSSKYAVLSSPVLR